MLTPVTQDLFAAETEIRFYGRVVFPLRMTVVRLPDGGLVLVSPIAMDDALAAEIAALGPVRHIVAPGMYHHLHAAAARERFPDAQLHGPPGLPAKRKDVRWDTELGDVAPWGGDDLAVHVVAGAPKMSEVVLLHRPSRTLLVNDLVFHVTEPRNLTTRAVLRLSGSTAGLGHSRLWRFVKSDSIAFDASLGHILSWDFDRMVMTHGEVVTEGARDRLAAALGRAPA
jgi:hypothetical protein